MNSARVGKAAEARARADCTTNGYQLITSQLSRGPADFLAAKAGQVLAVQVKRSLRSGGGIGPDEWNALVEFSAAFGAVPVVAICAPRKPVAYWRITGRKDGSGRRQPWEPFLLDEIEAAS
ncbi:MAG TPA: hypothetical protein VFJ21_05890 [Mycobacteriales bacterium]|nr:hypothetical protein [Mycobacteriales bacterium]